MAHSTAGRTPTKRKVLNNSNPDLRVTMANQGNNIQLTKRNNFFDEKENSQEKNYRQQATKEKIALRPALRTIALEKQAQQMQNIQLENPDLQFTTPKVTKHIRFNLGSGHNETVDSMTPTPPPKEFKRMNNERKTLRNDRCMSTIITDRERAMLFDHKMFDPYVAPTLAQSVDNIDSPKPPAGFVKSMCKLYSDGFGVKKSASSYEVARKSTTDLNRSNSFSGSSRGERNTAEDPEESPLFERRGGSFRLFRSRSWSLRRKKTSPESPNSDPDTSGGTTSEPRLSPSYSVKSQDSGFSDSEKQPTSSLQQRTRFFTGPEFEDEDDPNLTQIPDFIAPSQLPQMADPVLTNKAKVQVTSSLSNIASLTEGLRLKRTFEDEEGQDLVKKSIQYRQQMKGLDNFHHAGQVDVDKLNSKPQLDSLADLSCDLDAVGLPAFSTPVRASFRRRMVRPKTQSVVFHLEDAKTPSKREAKTKLKEMKSRRRWSNIEIAELQHQTGPQCDSDADYDETLNIFERSEVPSCIEPSLVAVWSQFMTSEADDDDHDASCASNTRFNRHHLHETSQVSSLDGTRLSYMAPSLCVDGTSTQLLVQSFNQRPGVELSGQRSLLHYQSVSENGSTTSKYRENEETIIELEAKTSGQDFKVPVTPQANMKQNYQSVINTSPVNEWWKDLHAWCEPECMTYLQSKPILSSPHPPNSSTSSSGSSCGRSSSMSSPGSPSSSASFSSAETSSTIVEAIRKIQRSSKSIQVTFSALNNHLKSQNLVQMSKTVQVLLTQIQEHVFEFNLVKVDPLGSMGSPSSDAEHCEWNFPGLRKAIHPVFDARDNGDRADQDKGLNELLLLQQRTVLQLTDRLKLCTHRCQYTPQQPLAELRRIMDSLHKAFKVLIDKMITKEIKPLIREISHPSSEVGIRSALHTIIHLGNEGPNSVCSLIAQEGGVRALLKHCKLPANLRQSLQHQDLRVLSLRGLSAICCMADCIRELENCNGLTVIDDLLSSRQSSLEDRIESAGLLAQITSPWITDNHKIENLDAHVASMVSSLTSLSRLNGGEETFLLVTAALANLTFMSPLAASAMKQYKTAQALVNVVRSTMDQRTLFSKDQVVTVLANLAANANIRHDIQTLDGVGFLIAMLETRIYQHFSPAELSAAERVQKKSAIALSRLCNDPIVCRDLLRLGGIDRLVELCKNPSERNYSDAVLVACLAVLRRVKHNLESKRREEINDPDDPRQMEDSRSLKLVLDQLDATDLVQPKLVDSFVEYSSRNGKHSYV